MQHHLIFEGAELAGKSYLMAPVYNFLEEKYNQNKVVLDGCHWFNSDVGIFGTTYGKPCIEKYTEMLSLLKDKNILFEKFHISDIVYNRLHNNIELDYSKTETKLKNLNTKIILCTYTEDEKLISERIKDRLNLYPHYKRILHDPKWYIQQQQQYIEEVKKSQLPYKIIDLTKIPNQKYKDVLKWIGEK
ncbi:hypothetical protein KKA15_03235 [Patescibacteria group bacterium]|nr:hypothetical protein [Patescibacteria group bacterium]